MCSIFEKYFFNYLLFSQNAYCSAERMTIGDVSRKSPLSLLDILKTGSVELMAQNLSDLYRAKA